ncbi:MAG TPA: response regulator transcription factor [Acidimicrobiia bacterium]
MMIRVLLADDQAMIRSGLRMILESEADLLVIGEAENGEEAIRLSKREKPDVVLMDVRMPGVDGLEATRLIHQTLPDVKVIVLTTFDLDEYIYAALRGGASGFLLKDADSETLIRAIRIVAAGDALIAPSVTRRLIDEFASRPTQPRVQGLDDLTEREIEVLKQMARGLSNAEIAEALFVSETTVKSHVSHLLTKLQLRDRVQAVVAAYEAGLVAPGQ